MEKDNQINHNVTAFAKIQKRHVLIENLSKVKRRIGKPNRVYSNDIIHIRNCSDSIFIVGQNQRMSTVIYENCKDCVCYILDSAVLTSRTSRIINCKNCEFIYEDVDVRKVEVFNTTECIITYIKEPAILQNVRIIWREGCSLNSVRISDLDPIQKGGIINLHIIKTSAVPQRAGQFISKYDEVCNIHHVLFYDEKYLDEELIHDLTNLNKSLLFSLPNETEIIDPEFIPTTKDILEKIKLLEDTPNSLTIQDLNDAYDTERKEYQETEEEIKVKIKQLVGYLEDAKHTVVYTGAGISTSANIPDFRGPTGVWTMRDKGEISGGKDLAGATPTYAHYAITELVKKQKVKFVVSTNMDGLHLRSGLLPHLIVEQHGNMYKERCEDCGKGVFRTYDTMETVNDMFMHYTGRYCDWCDGQYQDTIVHFSENYRNDMTQIVSMHQSRKADLAIVMGTSMNVQPAAAYPDKCLKNENGKLVIVNLQHTPYDDMATLRIYARTDTFMRLLMEELSMEEFDTSFDAIVNWSSEE